MRERRSELNKLGIQSKVMPRTLKTLPSVTSEINSSDVVLLHRIQYPDPYAGPFPIDTAIAAATRLGSKALIFDLDDSLHLQYPFLSQAIAAFCDGCSVGSHYLRDWALRLNPMFELIPSPVDTELFTPEKRKPTPNWGGTILGWHGTTAVQVENLLLLRRPLEELSRRYDITMRLLCSLGNRQVVRTFAGIKGLN